MWRIVGGALVLFFSSLAAVPSAAQAEKRVALVSGNGAYQKASKLLNPGNDVGFAAKAGSIALDGEGANSPYAAAVLNHIATLGLDLRIGFGRVRDEVLKAPRNKQEPFVYGSLGGE
jgi:uncharacterized caspase-like protein